jgi:hypothetical protein
LDWLLNQGRACAGLDNALCKRGRVRGTAIRSHTSCVIISVNLQLTDINIFVYIDVILPKQLSPEVWQILPETKCMQQFYLKQEKNNDTSQEGLCVLLASEFSSLNIHDGGGCLESKSFTEL